MEMNNKQTAQHLRNYANTQHGTFSWPTDACGYEQHIKFVNHRNANYEAVQTMTQEEWKQFVLDYAASLEVTCSLSTP